MEKYTYAFQWKNVNSLWPDFLLPKELPREGAWSYLLLDLEMCWKIFGKGIFNMTVDQIKGASYIKYIYQVLLIEFHKLADIL